MVKRKDNGGQVQEVFTLRYWILTRYFGGDLKLRKPKENENANKSVFYGGIFICECWNQLGIEISFMMICMNRFQPSFASHVKTSDMIFCVNQMSGFYMKYNTGPESVKIF